MAAAANDPEGRLRLLVAVLVWGMGKRNARMKPGIIKLLNDGCRDELLEVTAAEAGAGRPAAAYRAWSLPGLGPPFFTKWLWACGSRAERGTRCMIRDRNVVRSLRALGWDDREAAGTRGRPERYEAYCAALHSWAAQLSERAPTSAEDLEFVLFSAAGDFSRFQT